MCFFFSSRRRHTRCSRDWSSDVCSSDLIPQGIPRGQGTVPDFYRSQRRERGDGPGGSDPGPEAAAARPGGERSEEGRGGEGGRSRWAPCHLKKKNKYKRMMHGSGKSTR